MASKKTSNLTRTQKIAHRINGMSRFSRILLNMAISLILMAVLGLPIVYFFGSSANELEQGQFLYIPTLIIAAIWLAIYAYGWWALVGFDWDENNTWQAGPAAAWMLILGASAAIFLVLEILFALLFGLVL